MNYLNLFKFVQDGGPIMYLLLALNVVSFSIILYKLAYIIYFRLTFSKQLMAMKKSISLKNSTVQDTLLLAKERVANKIFQLELGLGFVKTTSTISPLLGLLGTVIGIFESFQIVASKGLSDPSLFAGGISMALITTIGGLIVAIPNYFCYNFIVSKYDSFEVKMEESILNGIKKENRSSE